MDDETLDNSYFASHPASSTASLEPDLLEPEASFSSSSSTASTPDSLANASFTDIEARALEFLSASPPSAAPIAGFRLEDLPRAVPTTALERDEAHAAALDFLRRSLDEAEKDEWRHRTPAVFAAPSAPASATGAPADALNVGLDDAAERPWQDRAFNVECWQVEGLGWGLDGFAGTEAPPLEAAEWSGRFEEGEGGFMT